MCHCFFVVLKQINVVSTTGCQNICDICPCKFHVNILHVSYLYLFLFILLNKRVVLLIPFVKYMYHILQISLEYLPRIVLKITKTITISNFPLFLKWFILKTEIYKINLTMCNLFDQAVPFLISHDLGSFHHWTLLDQIHHQRLSHWAWMFHAQRIVFDRGHSCTR